MGKTFSNNSLANDLDISRYWSINTSDYGGVQTSIGQVKEVGKTDFIIVKTGDVTFLDYDTIYTLYTTMESEWASIGFSTDYNYACIYYTPDIGDNSIDRTSLYPNTRYYIDTFGGDIPYDNYLRFIGINGNSRSYSTISVDGSDRMIRYNMSSILSEANSVTFTLPPAVAESSNIETIEVFYDHKNVGFFKQKVPLIDIPEEYYTYCETNLSPFSVVISDDKTSVTINLPTDQGEYDVSITWIL